MRKFDEIVEFAGIEQFLDTPVKRYSSGMYVRLAFAVAAHLEPEILLVDEVLAVGDVEFQRKCLGKMHDVAGDGRTVVFVATTSTRSAAVRPRAADRRRPAGEGGVAAAVVAALHARAGAPAGGRRGGRPGRRAAVGHRRGAGPARDGSRRSHGDGASTAVHFGQPSGSELCGPRGELADPEAVFEVGVSSGDGDRVLTAQNIDRERPPRPRSRPGPHEVEADLR